MLNQQLKNKIVNTISQYEQKCQQLQVEINLFRTAIEQLNLLPAKGELDKHLFELQEALHDSKDSQSLQQRIELLVGVIANLRQKKQENKTLIGGFIKRGSLVLEQLAVEFSDRAILEKLKDLFEKEAEEPELLEQFLILLKAIASQVPVQKQQAANHLSSSPEILSPGFSHQINISLSQLLGCLSIPDEFSPRLEALKSSLSEALTSETLTETIHTLTELVIEAFDFEQKRIKNFLSQFVNHLNDFENYLVLSATNNTLSQQETKQLEFGIQANIKTIRNHFDSSLTFAELSTKINSSLELISLQLKEYKDSEQRRISDYEQKIAILQEKLVETEQSAEQARNLLSFQKIKFNEDYLTGLPNRASYEENIVSAYYRWERGYGELSLALADIDYFKKINDNYGHLSGDRVLKKIASIFKESIRTVDFLARFGGEEFIFIFERTPCDEARKILENLRQAVEDCEFFYCDTKVDVTVSFGLTTLRHQESIESLFIRTDEAMYLAKRGGRNRIEAL